MNSQTSLPRISRFIALSVLIAPLIVTNGTSWSSAAAGGEEWRPVDPADLALKAAVVEPNADAEAIFWDIRIDDGGENDLVLSHYVRIKIFTERGRENHSKVEIPYTDGIKIKDIAARTVKADGSIVELARTDIIEKTIVKLSGFKLKTKTFAFPGIELGAIIEYKWREVISNSSAHNMRLQFQRDLPVQAVTYRIKPPRRTSFHVRPFNMPMFRFEEEKNGFQVATVRNIAAFREEPLMPPEQSVRSWALVRYHGSFFDYASYTILALQVHYDTESYMKVDDQIKQKAAEIVAGANTPEEKLQRIFDFCRTRIKNTEDKTSGFTGEQLEKLKANKKPADTLKRGVGHGIDINLLFGALATAAGFDARVALLPDRGQVLFSKMVTIPGAIRPACIAISKGSTWTFFDPGLRYITPGMLRWQEEGVDALIADARPRWTTTPLSSPEKTKEKRVADLRLAEDGTLEGDITVEYTGHLAVERKLLFEDDSPAQREENIKEAIKARLSSAQVTNVLVENATDSEKPFRYKYHVRIPEYAQRTGKRLFFQPGYFHKESIQCSAPVCVATRYTFTFHGPKRIR